MRISDWSSDVCSSDLGADSDILPVDMNASFGEVPLRPDHRLFDCFHMRGEDPLVARNQRKERGGLRHGECEVATAVACVWIPDLRSVRQFAVQEDRKRVVSGKSVSVRVDIGGGSYI